MTVFGYLRVNPQAIAGTADMLSWWMRFLGCSEVVADIWQGPHRPPGLDRLLDRVRPGDEVRVAKPEAFGPSPSHVREAAKLFQRRGVLVVVMKEAMPNFETCPEPTEVYASQKAC
ncbi:MULTISPECIES: recombinase family protein [Amycolatopsis]|uniref:Resolvase/invertase-type recombinase catalytic domain-containing protein n=2 Tax=Amycolatopsis TaxID=1813 RepID=A0A229S4D1_9PSEU|nr:MULTISPECIES: recombinase family protein [Amycolatopsis]AXB41314.1 hypothetical protein A4R43_01255 [Amycolatopsis albispora]OXM53787.1 hypothetical protein CFP71_21485 [Amycolatopsis thailandensis]